MADNSRNVSRIPPVSHPNVPWSLQQLHQNSHNIASSATQRIQDLQYYVVQGLSPLINSATLRSPNSPHSHLLWSRNSMEFLPDQRVSSAHPTDAAPSQDYVIDMGNQEVDSNNEAMPNNQDGTNNAFGNGQQAPPPRNRPTENASELDSLRNTPEFQMILSFAEKYIPFLSILLMKLVFDHKLGILSIIGLFFTFCHANAIVKKEVAKQGKRRLLSLLWVFFNLTMCIVIIYGILADEGLAYALVFVTPYSSPISMWDVLWIVSITDFVIRILAVLVKLCILAVPAKLVAFHKKGNHYLFVERTSQLYRTVAPMQHWLYFFSESYTGPSKVFGVILSAAYLIFKFKSILSKAKMWKRTFFKVIQSKTYGVTPSVNQIKEAGDSCPICQDDYKSPSMLQCKHIFCEDCVALWFDRERTCPICRAQIADDPAWRDGSTSLTLQIF